MKVGRSLRLAAVDVVGARRSARSPGSVPSAAPMPGSGVVPMTSTPGRVGGLGHGRRRASRARGQHSVAGRRGDECGFEEGASPGSWSCLPIRAAACHHGIHQPRQRTGKTSRAAPLSPWAHARRWQPSALGSADDAVAQCQVHQCRQRRDAELFLDRGLVVGDRLGTQVQLLPALGGGAARGEQAEDVELAAAQRSEPLGIRRGVSLRAAERRPGAR